ncbi:hypothetical protein [Fodinicola acaciae]|uniref:hypothetical protein n=1 Tax=Fodinicola acaciae TaxID=2681555 RepID=UPI0013D8D002|nr:hypothetical protein [Fodinicola acaciae]
MTTQHPNLTTEPHDNGPDTGLQVAYWLLRQAHANLIAAGYATICADLDGEPNPLAYLVDELPHPPDGHRLADNWPPDYPDAYFTDYQYCVDPDEPDELWADPDEMAVSDDRYESGRIDGGWC